MKITNVGNVPAKAPFNVAITQHSSAAGTDLDLTPVPVDEDIAPGATVEVDKNVTLIGTGRYTFTAMLDSGQTVAESNENNNTKSTAYTVV